MINAGNANLDAMVEQTAAGSRELQTEQRDGLKGIVGGLCDKHRGTVAQFASAAGISSDRLDSYLNGTVPDLDMDEMNAVLGLASKLGAK